MLAGVMQTLEHTEQSREQLEEEVMILNKERAEVTEQLNIVSIVLVCVFSISLPYCLKL